MTWMSFSYLKRQAAVGIRTQDQPNFEIMSCKQRRLRDLKFQINSEWLRSSCLFRRWYLSWQTYAHALSLSKSWPMFAKKHEYNQTCVQRPPLGPQNSGCCWQVVVVQRHLYVKFKIKPQNGGRYFRYLEVVVSSGLTLIDSIKWTNGSKSLNWILDTNGRIF